MIINNLLTYPHSRKNGSQRGSGLRRIVCLLALLVIFVAGARAVGPTSFNIYDGRSYNENAFIILQACARENVLTSSISDDGVTTFATTDGKVLVSYSSNEGFFRVPTDITPADDILSFKPKTNTLNWIRSQNGILGTNSSFTIRFQVAVNEQNFPDQNFRNWVLANCETEIDNVLSKDEITAVTEINVSDKSIANLKGIEYFTALRTLDCRSNNLTELDLSKNTALIMLDCRNNNLTTLDVSGMVYAQLLDYLYCFNNKIRGEGMTKFVNSLPKMTNGQLYVYDSEGTEGNEMTTIQVQAAIDKGWNVMMRNGSNYLGVDAPSIPIDDTNFPNENFRNYVRGKSIDKNEDGYLSSKEIAAVTMINVSDKSINNLKGIEYFTALTLLYCPNNQLTTLDLSNNTALTQLYCGQNQLTTLDLSNNTALTLLYCPNNQLTALDVKNTKLSLIACFDNQLRGSEMDRFVQSLPQVETGVVEVFSESGTEGNVMTTIQVNAAIGKGWKIHTSIGNDYEGVAPGIAINDTNFPDTKFRTWVSNNCDTDKDTYLSDEEIAEVTDINVFRLGITCLQGIEFFTELTTLACESNQLTALDVSSNTKLTSLECYGNKLAALNVSNNTKLTKLDCSVNLLNNLDVSKNTALTELNCDNNKLAALDVSNNVNLTSLSCTGNQLSTLDVSNNANLTSLGCAGNQLSTLDVSNNANLTSLGCASNQIRGSSMTALVNSLPKTGGTLAVIKDETATGNEMTIVQVAAAKAKGWNPKWFDGRRWQDYSGVIVPGDANGDGEVNALDIATLRDYILGLNPTPFSLESADLNEDGKADIVDLTKLIEMLK